MTKHTEEPARSPLTLSGGSFPPNNETIPAPGTGIRNAKQSGAGRQVTGDAEL